MKRRNPILPSEYHFPDGEPHVVNGELFVYPSFDETKKGYCSKKLYVVHSKDLENWKVDGPSFSTSLLDWDIVRSYPPGLEEAKSYDELPDYLKQYLPKHHIMPFGLFKSFIKWLTRMMQGGKSKRLLFAPDAITIKDKTYLFFCTSDGAEGVAVSDSPFGPFKDPIRIVTDKTNTPINGIDPAVFMDDDGKCYLYWGQINSFGAELTEDMTKVKEDTIVSGLLTEEKHSFHEGSSMRKIGDTYYYIFADTHRGKPTSLGYATSSSPLGPFTYQGIIIDNDGCDPKTWNNHGSIEEVDGKWYVFYHRSSDNSRFLRRMCAEPITIDESGLIKEAKMTSIGMGEPYKTSEILPANEACILKNAFISGELLVIQKGESEITYRYIEKGSAIDRISFDGIDKTKTSFDLSDEGELTIRIKTEKQMKIPFFKMNE